MLAETQAYKMENGQQIAWAGKVYVEVHQSIEKFCNDYFEERKTIERRDFSIVDLESQC